MFITLAVVVATSVAAGFALNLPLRVAPSADQRAVETAFRGAITAELQVQSTAVEPPGRPFTAAELPAQHDLDADHLSAFTTGPLFERALSIADSAHLGQVTRGRAWQDAGVTSVDFNAVSVQGDHATVDATAEAWFNFNGQGIPPGNSRSGADGHNGVTYHADVIRTLGNHWKVSNYAWHFLPGEGP